MIPESNDVPAAGPWGGFGSLKAQVDALRCARFKVGLTFELTARGLVAQGFITEGSISAGMVLLPVLSQHPNVCTPLAIQSVEAVIDRDGVGNVGLVLGDMAVALHGQAVELSPGTVVDVLQREPSA